MTVPLVLGAVWLLFASQLPQDAVLDRLAGEYQHSGGEADQRGIEQAIDQVVGEMVWIARDIARDRLRETNQIPRTLRIVRDGHRIRISFDGREREASVRGAPVKVVGITGDALDYTLDVSSSCLVQRFEDERGGRINMIRAEGDVLVVRVTIFSARLPANVVYELRYTRR